jgi:transcriptional regulator with XRE-family HTH domain
MAPIVGVQCWIARTALGWNLRQLGRAAKVSAHTIARFERGIELKATTVQAIQATLEKAGVVFIDADDGGPGARLLR